MVLLAKLMAGGLMLASLAAAGADEQRHVTGSVTAQGSTVASRESTHIEQFDHNPYDVKGYVHATRGPAGIDLASGSGPAVCLDVRGNLAGAIYLVDANSQPPGTFMYVTAVDGGPGRPDRIGFIAPLPRGALDRLIGPGCAPRPELAVLTFDGDIVVRD